MAESKKNKSPKPCDKNQQKGDGACSSTAKMEGELGRPITRGAEELGRPITRNN